METADTTLRLDHATDFLNTTSEMNEGAFGAALLQEVVRVGGDLGTMDMLQFTPTIFPSSSIIQLHGITACGGTIDQAARNWRRMAEWLTDPASHITERNAQLAAWAIEAMTAPDIVAEPALLRRACNDVIRLAPMSEGHNRTTAEMFLKATEIAATPASA